MKLVKLRYSSIDGYSESRSFKTMRGASRYATKWLGPNPEVGHGYAVSPDGIGKVEAFSVGQSTYIVIADLSLLFPALASEPAAPAVLEMDQRRPVDLYDPEWFFENPGN
jgi:hypothetical protein